MTMEIAWCQNRNVYILYVCIYRIQQKNNNFCLIRKSVTGAYATFWGYTHGGGGALNFNSLTWCVFVLPWLRGTDASGYT